MLLPKNVTIIDSGVATAKQTEAVLEQHHLLNPKAELGTCTFYSNGNPDILTDILQHDFPVAKLDF